MVSEFVIDFHIANGKLLHVWGQPGQAAAHLNVLILPKQGRSLHSMSNFDKGMKMTRLLVKSPDTSAEPIAGSITCGSVLQPAINLLPGEFLQKKQRDAIATRMTEKQIGKARELAKKCIANRFRGC